MICLAVSITIIALGFVFHEDEPADEPKVDLESYDEARAAQREGIVVKEIRADYDARVGSIFAAKCFDCHGSPRYPWFYGLPGIRGQIDKNVARGKEAVDMSLGFPFGGKLSPLSQLRYLRGALAGNMPPRKYVFVYPQSLLTPEESITVNAWLDASEKLLLGL